MKASTAPSATDGGEGAFQLAAITEADFTARMKAANDGDESQLAFVKSLLAQVPRLVEKAGDVGGGAENAWARRASGRSVLAREATTMKAAHLREELLGAKPTAIERLLVERVVICWLQVSFHDCLEAGPGDRSLRQAEFDIKRQESMQRRYLRAIRTLAEVRRLERPAVQVNIAENQVNVGAHNR